MFVSCCLLHKSFDETKQNRYHFQCHIARRRVFLNTPVTEWSRENLLVKLLWLAGLLGSHGWCSRWTCGTTESILWHCFLELNFNSVLVNFFVYFSWSYACLFLATLALLGDSFQEPRGSFEWSFCKPREVGEGRTKKKRQNSLNC